MSEPLNLQPRFYELIRLLTGKFSSVAYDSCDYARARIVGGDGSWEVCYHHQNSNGVAFTVTKKHWCEEDDRFYEKTLAITSTPTKVITALTASQ